jgi:hypothetical protein
MKNFFKLTWAKVIIAIVLVLLPFAVMVLEHFAVSSLPPDLTLDQTPAFVTIPSALSNLLFFPYYLVIGRPFGLLGIALFGDAFYFSGTVALLFLLIGGLLSLGYSYLIASTVMYIVSILRTRTQKGAGT